MGKAFDHIPDRIADFLRAQHLFFVATAPLEGDGHVNLSPKGLDTFRVLDRSTVAWLDLVGSGAETIAHLKDNGRITLMFCAFDGPPMIVRLYGRGEVLVPGDEAFESLRPSFPDLVGSRSIIVVRCHRVAPSCGYAVPRYAFEGNRDQLLQSAERKGEEGLLAYQRKNNERSIDGLPALSFDDG